MKYIPYIPPYDRPEFGFMKPTDDICDLCGGIIWPDEDTEFSEEGYFCHTECVEEERYGAQFTSGQRCR